MRNNLPHKSGDKQALNQAAIVEFTRVARPVILDYFAPNCCVAATAITIGVFRALGIPARPCTCRVSIFNRAYVDRSQREGRIPQGLEETRAWCADGVSWAVGVGYGADSGEGGWPGHLMAVVAGSVLVDASIEQANRPQKDIVLPPVLAVPAPADFLLERSRFYLHSTDGGLVIYEPLADRSWRRAPDWVHRDRHERAIERIVDALKRC